MLLRSQELNLKKKDFFKGKIILLYGENQDLIKDLSEQILIKFKDEQKTQKNIFEEDIIKDPQNIINYYLNGSLFDENKNILVIKNSSDKIIETLNKIKNNIDENTIIINSEILLKNSKLRQFGEYDKLAVCIPCYQETKLDLTRFLTQQLQINKIQLSEKQIEIIIDSSSLKRSKIKEVIEKINLYKNSEKIKDKKADINISVSDNVNFLNIVLFIYL
jgi:DNA polymerase III delta subunit